ncbi:MAG: enoyl-CoA hydratase/isomerase family protein [Firmicutes bacterium]|nr:enoyl-CoA hydratase/isomerase family protein [Bacillota bacterium]
MQPLETFTLEKIGSVGIVRMNRPKAFNAFTSRMFEEMELITRQIEDEHDLLCIILTGEGRHFCAGIDISLLSETSTEWSVRNVSRIHARLSRWENLTQPTIAAINGSCIGGGLEYAMTCDIRIAASDANFSVPEVSFGLSPDMGGSQRLPRLVGPSQAKKLLLSGERFDAQEALRIGAVDEVVEPDRLMERAIKLANKIAAQPPMAVRFAKKAVNLAMESSLQAGLLFEQVQSIFSLGSEDKDEAAAAFLEKRAPHFKGR